MKTLFTTVVSTILLLLFSVVISHADVPREVSFQGLLTDDSGVPLTAASVSLRIRLYSAVDAALGSAIFDEEHDTVALTDGVYSIRIGAGEEPGGAVATNGIEDTEINAARIWAGVSVNGGTELLPRIELTSVFFALKSRIGGEGDGPSVCPPIDFQYRGSDIYRKRS